MKKLLVPLLTSLCLTGALLTGSYFAYKYHKEQQVIACTKGVFALAYELKLPLPKPLVFDICRQITK